MIIIDGQVIEDSPPIVEESIEEESIGVIIATETRNVLDKNNNIIGTLTLPENTSESKWERLLSLYTYSRPIPTITQIIEKKLADAKKFGKKITDDFIKENVALGITQLGLTNHVRKFLFEAADALEKGSTYDAITEIRSLNDAGFDSTILTPSRILSFRNDIERWLEIPLATAWNDPETWLQ